ncbi:2-oxoacid:acceptor oxidoreductase subunit alpha [Sphingobacteriales bacterium UPWRP_1]|nr:2-oxoglutarate ferredoxin oxidoreductase subunit alpha [Sphingobacteriales bacterium TSM_CSS]PSJ75076.1 2-oxoacid:acceptor oxidoreductase subunit alpha [Sphingobacteriales bacterium UPWRP_1]
MSVTKTLVEEVTIKFAGDSGDGMQLTGTEFTNNTALTGSDLATFPDFPAEIRAPQGTLPGVSGYQLHFGSRLIFTPGDTCDVLVAMNAAALRVNLSTLKKGGAIIADIAGFDSKNLRLAKCDTNPLEDGSLNGYEVIKMDITKLTRDCLKDLQMGTKEKDRSKNMFVLGFLYWMYNRTMDSTTAFLQSKFKKQPDILEANLRALKAGYNFGETTETFNARYEVKPAPMAPGRYRSIMGNQALVIGLITAAQKAGLPLFYGSYPITPASDILHGLAQYKHYGAITFQAEDEIAAICSAIGAAYGGNLAITGTSGPGMALKAEAMGLAVMLELPLVICNIQRGGPSTGLPTKTEQADLLQALYGRNGECPMPVLAAKSPSDCFYAAIEACKIAIEHMTPVILLSDGYIANGAEPWRFPKADDIEPIKASFKQAPQNGELFMPYERNENLVRPWAIPGTKGLQHRIGGLEKEAGTGNVSYTPANHEYMVKVREAKVEKIAQFLPPQTIETGPNEGDLLVLGWGSTYGAIKSAVMELNADGYAVAHAHLRYLRPLPQNLEHILRSFKKVLIPEINAGQLVKVIREKFLIPAHQFNKVQGLPLFKNELKNAILQILENK